jgi:hypothetical protein
VGAERAETMKTPGMTNGSGVGAQALQHSRNPVGSVMAASVA